MAESKDDSDHDVSHEMKKVSFADPIPSSPLPSSPLPNPATASVSSSSSTPISADKGWPDQEAAGIDYSRLTPLSPVVMHRQATINIGTIGHVAHGKSTVVKAISGVQTVRFKTELERNITIKLGYANAKIYRCDNPKCPRPGNYKSYGSAMEASPTCDRAGCGGRMILQRHVSFVDCPGHDILMATMLNGAAVMDAALLLIAGNESCPQPQTSEHLAAVEIMKLKHLLILQNKIDLVKEKEAAAQYDEILNFIRGTVADGSPIIPISAQLKYNIEVICIAAGTPVNLAQGVSVAIEDVAQNDHVLALHPAQDGQAEGLAASRVTAVLDRKMKRCVELLFNDGRTLVCTPDHQIRTPSGEWVEAQHLVVGESDVAVGIEYPQLSPQEDADSLWMLDVEAELGFALNLHNRRAQSCAFARLLGCMLTTGCVSDRRVALCLQHQLDVETCWADIQLLTGLRTEPDVVLVESSLRLALPPQLLRAFARLGMTVAASGEQRIHDVEPLPTFLLDANCPLSIVREFLGGLFGGRGHIREWDREASVSQLSVLGWSCSKHGAVSQQQAAIFIHQLYALLARCGVDPAGITLSSVLPLPYKQTVALDSDELDSSSSVTLMFSFGASLLQPFHRSVSFRYACQKQMRLTAAVACFRSMEAILEQRERLHDLIQTNSKDRSDAFISHKQATLNPLHSTEPVHHLSQPVLTVNHLQVSDVIREKPSKVSSSAPSESASFALPFAPSSPTISRCSTPLSVSISDEDDSEFDEAVADLSSKQSTQYGVDIDYGLHLQRDARVLPLFAVKLVGRRDVGVQHVYDLSVPHGTSFTASGIVVHNCEYICRKIPVPVRDFAASPQLIVIRSFDVNKPGEEVDNLKGGVAGGSILKGVLRIGQEIEIRPGIVTKDKTGGVRCLPIKSKIVSLYAEHNDLYFAVPGGLIGVGTKIDPTLTRADRLVGQVLGDVGALPDIFTELEISFFLLRRLLGVKTDGEKKKQEKIKKLSKGEILMVNIGSTSTGARILQVKGDLAKVVLTSPVCTSEGEKLALSRRVEKHWRLIGWGTIRKGTRIVQSEAGAAGAGAVGMSNVVGVVAGLGVGGDGENVDEMDELSKEADQAGQRNDEEEEDEEEKD